MTSQLTEPEPGISPASDGEPPSRRPLVLGVLGAGAVAATAVIVLAISGAFSGGSKTSGHRAEGSLSGSATHARRLPARSTAASGRGGASRAGGSHANDLVGSGYGTSSCGGDLSVGPNTSCDFAQNVEQAYGQSSGGNAYVSAYSPSTGQTYTMSCTGNVPHACTGGNNAAVYFVSGPYNAYSCGGDLQVGPGTSCDFAQNVQQAYQSAGGTGEQYVSAYSPATGQVYVMDCGATSPHVCIGGNNASVYFP